MLSTGYWCLLLNLRNNVQASWTRAVFSPVKPTKFVTYLSNIKNWATSLPWLVMPFPWEGSLVLTLSMSDAPRGAAPEKMRLTCCKCLGVTRGEPPRNRMRGGTIIITLTCSTEPTQHFLTVNSAQHNLLRRASHYTFHQIACQLVKYRL